MKTIQEIRKDSGLSAKNFCEKIGMSKTTFLGRFNETQPKWLLTDIVAIANENKGEVRVSSNNKTYDIKG